MPTTYRPTTLGYASPRGYSPAYGGIPEVPDPTKTAGAALAGSVANLDQAKNYGRGVNKFMVNQYTGRVPGYKDMSAQSSENIAAALRGEVPQDVIDQLAQSAAERGIMRGVPGSQASNADYLRGLGLTSLGLQKYGEEALTGATHRLDQVAQFNPLMYATSPQEMQEAQLSANIYGAAPVPSAAVAAGKADLMNASRTTPGLTYTNLTPSGGGVVPSPVSAPPSNAPVIGYGTGPEPDRRTSYGGWMMNPQTGQYSWNLPQGAQSYTGEPEPSAGGGYNYNFSTGSYEPSVGYGTGTLGNVPDLTGNTYTNPWERTFSLDSLLGGGSSGGMTDEEWWNTFGGGAYDTRIPYGYGTGATDFGAYDFGY